MRWKFCFGERSWTTTSYAPGRRVVTVRPPASLKEIVGAGPTVANNVGTCAACADEVATRPAKAELATANASTLDISRPLDARLAMTKAEAGLPSAPAFVRSRPS